MTGNQLEQNSKGHGAENKLACGGEDAQFRVPKGKPTRRTRLQRLFACFGGHLRGTHREHCVV